MALCACTVEHTGLAVSDVGVPDTEHDGAGVDVGDASDDSSSPMDGGTDTDAGEPDADAGPGRVLLTDYGQCAFLRGSEAAFIDAREERWDFVGPWRGENIARIFVDGAILIEGERTNGCASARNPTGPGWPGGSPSSTVDLAYSDGPDGATGTGTRLRCVPDGLAKYCQELNVVTEHQVGSFFARSSTDDPFATFQGSFQINAGRAGLWTPITLVDTWQHVTASVATGSGPHIVQLIPADCRGDRHGFTARPVDLVVDLAQIEAGASFPSSPIRTDGEAASRALDSCDLTSTGIDEAIYTAPHTWTVWPEFAHNDGLDSSEPATHFVFSDMGGSLGLFFERSEDATSLRLVDSLGVVVTNTPIEFERGQQIALRYDPSTGALSVEGASTGDGTYAPIAGADLTSSRSGLRIGRGPADAGAFFGVISPARRAD